MLRALIAALLLTASATSVAEAQVRHVCAPRASVVAPLGRPPLNLVRRDYGFDSATGTVLEFWTADGGFWTVLRTDPLGWSCVELSGYGAKPMGEPT
jgi:hypothetical protein